MEQPQNEALRRALFGSASLADALERARRNLAKVRFRLGPSQCRATPEQAKDIALNGILAHVYFLEDEGRHAVQLQMQLTQPDGTVVRLRYEKGGLVREDGASRSQQDAVPNAESARAGVDIS